MVIDNIHLNSMHLEGKMYQHTMRQILLPEDFVLPFEGELNKNNRWVKLTFMIPWWEVEERYIRLFKSLKYGQKANSVRCALGALIIQNRLGLTDEETEKPLRCHRNLSSAEYPD